MNELPVKCSENPVYGNIDQPASSESFLLSENTNQTEKSGHSRDDHCNQHEVNPGKASSVRGSKRALFALVIFVGLISLLAVLLTILKFGSSNKGAVHGGWSDFGDWSECSVSCGDGIKERRRTCNNPPPANGGQYCAGDNMEAQSCNTEPCEGEKVVRPACPVGWVLHGKSCFLIINIETLKWSDARRTCQNLGGDLAIIRTAEENNFIFDLVKKQMTITPLGVWLGLTRKADKFYWIDETPLTGNYSAWANGEPNNARKNENCGYMIGNVKSIPLKDQGNWNDAPCSTPTDLGQWHDAPRTLCQKKCN